jgi:16S rRNA processing protein RimM
MSNTTTATWIPLADLLRPQGRVGEILCEPLSDLPGIFKTGTEVYLAAPGVTTPGSLPTYIEDHWFPTGKNAGRVVLKLAGCNTINEAEALSKKQLLIPSTSLPTLDADTFFVGDLVGCTFYDGLNAVGTIIDVEFATGPDGRTRLEDAAPLLALQLTADTPAEPVLVPFVRAWLDTVDIPNKRVVMHLPAGLLDSDPQDART